MYKSNQFTLCKYIKINRIHIAQEGGQTFTLQKFTEKSGYSNPLTTIKRQHLRVFFQKNLVKCCEQISAIFPIPIPSE